MTTELHSVVVATDRLYDDVSRLLRTVAQLRDAERDLLSIREIAAAHFADHIGERLKMLASKIRDTGDQITAIGLSLSEKARDPAVDDW